MFARLAVTNAAALLMAISSCLAGGIVLPSTLTVGGQKFEGATYSSHNDAKLTIQHKSGIARLQISELPKDLQAQLGYDPDKAAAELKREVDANLAAAAQAADEERARINAAERAKMKEQARDMAFDVSEHLSEGIFVIVCSH